MKTAVEGISQFLIENPTPIRWSVESGPLGGA